MEECGRKGKEGVEKARGEEARKDEGLSELDFSSQLHVPQPTKVTVCSLTGGGRDVPLHPQVVFPCGGRARVQHQSQVGGLHKCRRTPHTLTKCILSAHYRMC